MKDVLQQPCNAKSKCFPQSRTEQKKRDRGHGKNWWLARGLDARLESTRLTMPPPPLKRFGNPSPAHHGSLYEVRVSESPLSSGASLAFLFLKGTLYIVEARFATLPFAIDSLRFCIMCLSDRTGRISPPAPRYLLRSSILPDVSGLRADGAFSSDDTCEP